MTHSYSDILETTQHRIVSNGMSLEDLGREDIRSIKRGVFQQMLRRAMPTMEFHEGDLYNDVLALESQPLDRPFMWGFTTSHTSFSPFVSPEGHSAVMSFNDHVFIIEVTVTDRGTWGVNFHALKFPADSPESIAVKAIKENPDSRIEAIKQYRREMETITGVFPGLREAKLYVEEIRLRQRGVAQPVPSEEDEGHGDPKMPESQLGM